MDEIHVYEALDTSAEYLFRIETDYSYQEYQVDGEHFDDFMSHLPFETADIFVYKLVRSYENEK